MDAGNRRDLLNHLVTTGAHEHARSVSEHFFQDLKDPTSFDQYCLTLSQIRDFVKLEELIRTFENDPVLGSVVARRIAQHQQFLALPEASIHSAIERLTATNAASDRILAVRALFAQGSGEDAAAMLVPILKQIPFGRWPLYLIAGLRKTSTGHDFLESAIKQISFKQFTGKTAWGLIYLMRCCDFDISLEGETLAFRRSSDGAKAAVPATNVPQDIRDQLNQFNDLANLAKTFHVNELDGQESAALVLDDVLKAAHGKTPYSLIRLGDGDGNYLEDPLSEPLARFDQLNMATDFWGLTPRQDVLAGLSKRMADAVEATDALGIPDIGRMSRQCASLVKAFGPLREMRGLKTILKRCTNNDFGIEQKRLVSCHVHQHMQKLDFFPKLCSGLKRVHLVTCHPKLKDQIEAAFPVEVIIHETPIQYVERQKLGRAAGTDNIADFEALIAALPNDLHGEVFMIAAGFYGRLMTHDVKKRGGIALDIGSIANEWVGVSTRIEGLELQSMGRTDLQAQQTKG